MRRRQMNAEKTRKENEIREAREYKRPEPKIEKTIELKKRGRKSK